VVVVVVVMVMVVVVVVVVVKLHELSLLALSFCCRLVNHSFSRTPSPIINHAIPPRKL
jgi:hypothetical protein